MPEQQDWKPAGEPLEDFSTSEESKEAMEGAAIGAAAGLGCLGFGLLPLTVVAGVIAVLLIFGALRGGCYG